MKGGTEFSSKVKEILEEVEGKVSEVVGKKTEKQKNVSEVTKEFV